jgi:outer membrane protein
MLVRTLALGWLIGAALAAWPDAQPPVLSLEQALERAQRDGANARLQDLSLEAARAQTAQTLAGNDFKLQLTANYGHENGQIGTVSTGSGFTETSLGALQDKELESFSSGLKLSRPNTTVSVSGEQTVRDRSARQTTGIDTSVSQTIYDGTFGGRFQISRRVASLELKQTVLGSQADRTNLLYQVKQAYYTLATSQQAIDLDRRIIARREQEHEQTRSLYDAGRATLVDLQQAELNLETARLDLEDAQSQERDNRESLSQLMGMPRGSEYAVEAVGDAVPPSETLQALVEQALAARGDLQKLEVGRTVAALNVTLGKTASAPVVTATGSITYRSDTASDQAGAQWNAGLQVVVPIVDAGAAAAQTRAAVAQAASAALQTDQLRRSIAQEVEQSYGSVRTLSGRLEAAKKNVDLAQKKHELKQTQFLQGLASQLDVLEASVDESTAESDLQQARTQLELAVLKLQNVMGQ